MTVAELEAKTMPIHTPKVAFIGFLNGQSQLRAVGY
jgi:hypothetical protein